MSTGDNNIAIKKIIKIKEIVSRSNRPSQPKPQNDNCGSESRYHTLWCLINVPPLINFRKFFPPPGPYLDPPLIHLV